MSSRSRTNRQLAQYDAWVAANPGIRAEIRDVIQEALDDAGIAYDQVVVRIKDCLLYTSDAADDVIDV